MKIFSYKGESKYMTEIPNNETLEAIKEVEHMSKNPSSYKIYSSFKELLEEILEDN